MSYRILDDIPFKVDMSQLLKKLHTDEKSEEFNELKKMLGEAVEVARPKGLYKESLIDEKGENYVIVGGIKFESKVLRINLENNYKVYPYVATCGIELEQWSKGFNDVLYSYWADAIKEMAVRCAREVLLNDCIKRCVPVGKLSSMNPGSLKDWPLIEQRKLFSILGDTKPMVGVELTESCLMLPSKSVSGIWFITDVTYENCQLCTRENCPGRRAKFDSELYNKKYNLNS
jgi:hypothetical protein